MSWTVSGLDAAVKEWIAREAPSPAAYQGVAQEWAEDLASDGPLANPHLNVLYADESDPERTRVVHSLEGTSHRPLIIEMIANQDTQRVVVTYVGQGPREPTE